MMALSPVFSFDHSAQLPLVDRYFAHLVVAGVGDEEPAIGGHRHPEGLILQGVGGRAIVPAVTRGAGPRDTSDHARWRHFAYLVVEEVSDEEPAIGGHRHPDGLAQQGVGGRAIVPAVTRGAGPRDTNDHAHRASLFFI